MDGFRGASSTRERRAMSSDVDEGRQGEPSLLSSTSPVVQAYRPGCSRRCPRAAGRGSIRRRVSEERRAEAGRRAGREVTFDQDLALPVRRERVEGRVLVKEVFATGSIVAAGRGEDEPFDAGRLGRAAEPNRRAMVMS